MEGLSASVGGADHDIDTPGFLHCYNWFKNGVKNWSDSDPTSDQVQVDHMRDEDLYDLYLLDMQDLESLETPPSMSVWKKVWVDHFPEVVIREVKSVDTKDKVRHMSTIHHQLIRFPHL